MRKASPKDVSSSKLVPISLITIMFLGFAAILFQSYFSSDEEGKIIFKGPPDTPPGQVKKNITPTTGDYNLLPIADTFAYSTSPTSNYGTRASLEVDGDPIKITYFKFDLNDLSGKAVNSAKLYLYVIDSSGSSQTVKKVTDTTWGETTLTYNNKPALGAAVKTINGGSAGTWIEIDVTQAVAEKAGQLFSLAIDSTGADGLDFNSREALSNNPQLVVTTGTAPAAQCADGIDNDNDGATDYPNDPGCSSATDSGETGTAICDNGMDETNDRDTLADYRLSGGDSGCTSLTDTSEVNGECDDNLDSTSDADALADASDTGCTSTTDPSEIDALCDDTIDNDNDGATDYPADSGCTSYSDNDETNAPTAPFDFTISVSPDYGTVVKGSSISTTVTVTLTSGTSQRVNLSSSCPPASTCTRVPQTGFPTYTSTFTVATTTATTPNLYSITIRGLAPDGTSKTTTYKLNVTNGATAAQCIDGLDNDNDGRIDYGTGTSNDPGCSSTTDTSEIGSAICDNGVDEATDADSLADYRLTGGDPGCTSITATSEIDALCDDKADNDADTKIDYPADPGCTSYSDNNETDPPAGGTGFVSAQGTKLKLNGADYRFIGVNLFGAANNPTYDCGPANNYGNNQDQYLDHAFAYLSQNGVNAVRFWAFSSFTSGGSDFSGIDKVISYAKKYNMKIIPSLANHWGDCGETAKTDSWYQTGYTSTYKPYVQTVVTRYKNEPTILMWELINEPEGNHDALYGFTVNMSQFIKQNDPNHMVALATIGTGQAGTRNAEGEYLRLCQISTIDICNAHDYNNPTVAWPCPQWHGICHSYDDSVTANKPFFIGETGIRDNFCDGRYGGYSSWDPTCYTNTQRASYFDAKMDAALVDREVDGYVPWQWDNLAANYGTACSGFDDYCFPEGDPLIPVLKKYADIIGGGTPSVDQCADGSDNDNDGKTDYGTGTTNDPGCSSATDTTETGTAICDNGVDNDNDGLADYRLSGGDPGCSSLTDTAETSTVVCDNGVDETTDSDSLADYRLTGGDPGCTSITDTSEVSGLCDDKLDNDGDTKIDYPTDLGCTGYTDNDETDAPTSGSGTLDLRIATGNDDVEEQQSGNIYSGSSDLEMMNDGSNIQRAIGLRYQLNVPRGSSIINAYLQFTVDEATSDATSLTIQAHDVGNSPAFGSSTNDVTNRVKTTASALWVPVVWNIVDESGTNQRTSNIKSVIQEVTDRSDWVANNYLTIMMTGSGKRVARAYESSAIQAALLHVEYGQACTPACTSGQYCDAGVCKYVCSDGVDNDNDGKIDFGTATTNDAGCSSATDATETGTIVCDNGVDETNDADTLADYRLSGGDPGCASITDTSEVSGLCDDTLDNDADTFTDYPSDIGCTGYTDNDETNPPLCSDGIDNDNDGKIDYGTGSSNDPGCSSSTDILETSTAVCDNGADATNDRDTLADYRLTGGDPGCTSLTDTSEIDGQCDDNLDSTTDADTLADASDVGCFATTDPDEIDGQCDDKIDNDADGKIDFGTATTNDLDCSSYGDGEAPGPNLLAPPANYKVAFIGDSAGSTNFRNVLTLIKNEGADLVIEPGDLGYSDSPQAWEQQIKDVLDNSTGAITCVNDPTKKMFPFFISMGNHETGSLWTGTGNYKDIFKKRLDCIGAQYDYDAANGGTLDFLGTRSSVIWQNLFVTLTAPGESLGGSNEQKADYIKRKLNNSYLWDIVGFHRLMRAVQIGGKGDEHTYAAYDEARKAGAIIATAHEHSYERTWILSSFSGCSPYTDTTSSCPVADNTDPLTIWNEVNGRTGQTFAFVSGAGGAGNRVQTRCKGSITAPYSYPYGCNGEWASAMTTDDAAEDYGAFFIEFNVDGDPKKARAYFKTITGVIWENEPFTIINDAQ